MNKKIILIVIILIIIVGIGIFFVLKPKPPLPKPKVYLIHILHIEPGTPKNQEEFLLYAKALDKFLGIAEKHKIKISVQVEKEWSEACLKYDENVCKMIEKRGHELGTHTHNYENRAGIQKDDSFERIKEKMHNYIKERKDPVDKLSKYNDVICWGKFPANEFGRKLFLASHQVSIDLGFKAELTAHDDLDYIEYYSHPHMPSYNDLLKEDPFGKIMLVTGKHMKAKPKSPNPEEGEMHAARLNELKATFLEIYRNSKPNKINVFTEGTSAAHIEYIADKKIMKLREKALENFDNYLSFYDKYIKDGTAESVTIRELSGIYRKKIVK